MISTVGSLNAPTILSDRAQLDLRAWSPMTSVQALVIRYDLGAGIG